MSEAARDAAGGAGSDAAGPLTLREPAHRVSPRARLMWHASALVGGLVVVAVSVVAARAWDGLEPRWWLVGGLVVLAAAYVVVVPQWRYRVHRWETTDSAVHTQSGWWARENRIAPMSRVQTVDHTQGVVERLFGLASVTVTTASAAGALRIEGLDREVARRLVADLTHDADAVAGDAT